MRFKYSACVDELKKLLESEKLTLVISDGKEYFTSREKGIRPLLNFAESGKSFLAAADKIVGKAAALLYAFIGISALYAEVITHDAVRVCDIYGISVAFGVLTDKIVNREGNGLCPMEEAVSSVNEPNSAVRAVKNRLNELRANNASY